MHLSKKYFGKTASISELAIYTIGCLVFSFGAYLFIHAKLGTDPLDVFALGLQSHISITIGLAQALIALLCLSVVATWRRRPPPFSPLLTFFLCGSLIDILLVVDPVRYVSFSPLIIMLTGTLLCAYGSSLIIMSGFGIRAMDLVAIEMTKHWGMPFWSTKGVLEAALLFSGWYLGGPVGIGTLSFLVLVNTLIQPMMLINSRVLKLRNVGLPRLSATETQNAR